MAITCWPLQYGGSVNKVGKFHFMITFTKLRIEPLKSLIIWTMIKKFSENALTTSAY